MATLTVWKFDNPTGAGEALRKLESLQKQQLIEIQDAAVVEWQPGEKKPKTRQAVSLTGAGALGGAFWGTLFGLLFFIPFIGMAVGAVLGGLAARFSDYGIDDDFIKAVRDQVTEGTSALFLLTVTGSAAVDKLQAELKGKMGSLIKSNLSNEQEAKLNAAFGEQQAAWRIGPRTLPPPTGGSDELRDAIANLPQPDLATMQIVPQNEAEWHALVAKLDAGKAETNQAFAEQLGVSITQEEIEGINVYHVTPAEVDPQHAEHLFVYLHGGAYVLNGGKAGLAESIIIAHRLKMRVLHIDYRLPPQYPAPVGRDDVVSVYQHLLQERPAKSMAMGGTSGGGNMTMATVQRLIELGLDVPGALYLGTPGTDMSNTGDSWILNEGIDHVLITRKGMLEACMALYAPGRDLKDPLISPHYGDVHGFPPTLLITGTRDMLLSPIVRTHIKLRQAGVVADILVYDGVAHGDYIAVMNSPESLHAYAELNAFTLQHLQ
jgi:monoterpene epsilon-lactone hydrolase